MNAYYPFTSPIIMTDAIFVEYGGQTGTTTASQRQAAYTIAEEFVTRDLQTFLLPVTVTGTYPLTFDMFPIQLDYGYVNSVSVVRFIDTKEDTYYTISGTDNVSASLRDPILGLVDMHWLYTNCSCPRTHTPYKFQIVYNAGLATGTANSPTFEMALSMISESFLNEIEGHGNEAPGDVGVQEFSNQDYREKRSKLLRTSYGTSAKVQMAHRLLKQWRKPRYMRL